MKKLFIGIFLSLSTLASTAQAYMYYQSPIICRVEWSCDIVSTDFKTARDFCSRVPFAIGTATVYEYSRGQKATLKGYACLDSGSIGG